MVNDYDHSNEVAFDQRGSFYCNLNYKQVNIMLSKT